MEGHPDRRLLAGVVFVGVFVLAAGAVAAPAAASAPSDDAGTSESEVEQQIDVSVDDLDGQRYWIGQRFEIDGFDEGETVTFEHDDRFRQRTADDGTVVVSTETWAAGDWTVEAEDSGVDGEFTLNEQELEVVTFEPEHAVDDATLHVESNRPSFDVTLSSDDIEADELAAGFRDATVVGDRVVLEDVGGELSLATLDVSDLRGGVYDVDVEVPDADAAASATLEVSSGVEFEGNYPLPHEGSDVYWDVDGDRAVSSQDLSLFFATQHSHPVFEEHAEHFDFNGDGTVGQPDVVALFEAIRDGVPVDREPDLEFEETYSSAPANRVAEISLDVQDTDEAWVTVEHDDIDGQATVHLTDVEQETVTVNVEIPNLSQGADPADVFDVEGAELGPQTEETGEFADIGDNQWYEGFEFTVEAYPGDPEENRAEDRARLTLTEPTSSAFGEDVVQVPADEYATVDVAVEGSDEFWVAVEHEDLDGQAVVHVSNVQESTVSLGIYPDELEREDTDDAFVALGGDVDGSRVSGEFAEEGADSWENGTSYVLRTYVLAPDEHEADDRARLDVVGPAGEDPDARFEESTYPVDGGASAPVALDLTGTDEAWVTAEHEDVDGQAVVHLENVVQDGDVRVDLDPVALVESGLGAGVDVTGAAIADDAIVTGELADADPEDLDDAFDLTLRTYVESPQRADATDRSRVEVGDPPVGDVTAMVAPADASIEGAETPADVVAAAAEAEEVATGDWVVAHVEDSYHVEALGEDAGDFDAEDTDVGFEVVERGDGVFGGTSTYEIGDEELAEDAVVLTDVENDEFVVAFQAGTVASDGDDLELSFVVGPDNRYRTTNATEPIRSTDELRVVDPEPSFAHDRNEDDRVLIPNDESATIGVETALAPGTEGVISVVTRDHTYTEDFVVGDDGVGAAELDFGGAAPGELLDTVEVTFDRDGGGSLAPDVSTEAEGLFVDADGAPFEITADAPEEVAVGAGAALNVTVENTGYQPDQQTIVLDLGDTGSGWGSVPLEPGQTWAASFAIDTDEPGTVEWGVETGTDEVTGSTDVVSET